MKVILKENVENLGEKGDIKNVSPGYARNHLIPRGLAVEATPQRIKEWEQRQEKISAENQKRQEEALSLAEKISREELVFNLPAGDGGKLFGSVTSSDIMESLKEKGITVEKKKIDLSDPIKSLGNFSVTVRLMPGVKTELPVKVEKST